MIEHCSGCLLVVFNTNAARSVRVVTCMSTMVHHAAGGIETSAWSMQVGTPVHGHAKHVQVITYIEMANPGIYEKLVLHATYGIRPDTRRSNVHERYGWSFWGYIEASAWSMQFGTPLHGRAKLVQAKTGRIGHTPVYK